jgi:hypothetical protein
MRRVFRVRRLAAAAAVAVGVVVSFPPCTFADEGDFTLSAAPSSVSVGAGSSVQVTLSWATIGGYTWGGPLQTVGGGPSGLPRGAGASSPGGNGSAVWTITTSATTPAGSYPLTFTVTDGKKTHSVSLTVIVTSLAPPPTASTTTTTALPLIDIPQTPASNGTPDCQAALAAFQRDAAAAKYVNDEIGRGSAKIKAASKLVAVAQSVLNETVAEATKLCGAPTAGGYGTLPPDNGTAGCRNARAHIQYINGELAKAYGNQRFQTPDDGSKWARVQQLETRVNRLLADLDRSAPAARKACA